MASSHDPKIQAARFELEARLPKGIPIDVEAFFPKLDGWGVDKQNRKRADLLANLEPVLKAALRPNETVLYALPCIVNFWWEQLFMGAWAQLINRTALVLTGERLLLVHLDGTRPASFMNQVPRSAVTKLSAGPFSVVIKLTSGKIVLSGVIRQDKKVLKTALVAHAHAVGRLEHLCATCFAAHAAHVESCPMCGTFFKSPHTAAMRSLLLPGLGDYYLGHRGLAMLEMVGSLVTWALAVGLATMDAPGLHRVVTVGMGVLILAVANGSDAALTRAQARKGLMSLDGKLPTTRGLPGRS